MITWLIVSGSLIVIVYRFNKEFREGYYYAERRAAPLVSMMPTPASFTLILQKYFTYYQRLSSEDKISFARKVTTFVRGKQFIPRGVNEVTIEAKVLIAASAVQLTFGLPNIYLRHFKRILVYPNDYYSSITKRYHRGEVNPLFGIIVLSWQSFVDGYIHTQDSVNLGLHEMAHALRLENVIRNEEYHFFDLELLRQFDEFATQYCSIPNEEANPFFRPYACTNEHEFFAVAVENFFERSQQFKHEFPAVYMILVKLLNQDPLTRLDPVTSIRTQ